MNLKDSAGKAVNVVHRAIYNATGGRIGGSGMGMPVVILTTIGRKSGQPRTTMLTTPLEDGDRVIVVASWGGDDRHPQWYLNLQANPEVELTLRGKKHKMRASVATPTERAELWPRVTKDHKNYAGYQGRTDREIPLVILEPA